MRGLGKNCTRWRTQTDRQTHGYNDSMTNSAQWGRVGENSGKSEHLCGVITTALKISKNSGKILLVTEENTRKTRTKQSFKMVERTSLVFLPSNKSSGKSAPFVVGMAATVEVFGLNQQTPFGN